MDQIIEVLSSYLPRPIAASILELSAPSPYEWSEQVDAAVIFADIAGFTPVAEALGRHGPQGTEELTRILNHIFTPMIAQAHQWGGVIGKFAGDAMTLLFTGKRAARRAVACALALRDIVAGESAFHTQAGRFTVHMKFGLAAGSTLQSIVGSERRAECIFAGRAIDDAANAEHHASPGEIVLHPSLLTRLVTDELTTVPLGEGYVRLQEAQIAVDATPHPPLPVPPDVERAAQALRPFLPPPIHERLLASGALFVNEHRHVTVLFVGFGGIDYTGEHAVPRLKQYVERVAEVTERLGGTVQQVEMGDKGSKSLLLFGAPIAYEDNERRALLCAHAIQHLSEELDFITGQHIGISSGRAFVGNIGSSRRRTYSAIGDTVNLAARLMQAAEPGQTLVSETTYQAASHHFLWHALQPLKVKGKAVPTIAYELAGQVTDRPLRLQEPQYALPMVGRERELDTLKHELEQVRDTGQGRVVGLVAEAGMGKSRLAAEVIAHALRNGFQGFGGHGLSHGMTTPYLAWRPAIRGLLNLGEDQPLEQQIEAMHHHLERVAPDMVARLPLLGDALGLDIPDNDLTASLEAEMRQQSLFALITDLIRHQAQAGPVLLVMEDAHWLDGVSRELAQVVVLEILHSPVLFLTVYRPPAVGETVLFDSSPPEHFTEIALQPFSAEETAELVRRRLSGHTVPGGFIEQLQERAAGNPFFVDEFINLLQDQGHGLDDPEALEELQIPESLHVLVVSRLDRLGESERMTIRIASVIGRLFRARWLMAIYPSTLREELVYRHLSHLDNLALVLLNSSDPELEYLFKHAITQEVAYETLTFATRRMLHERVAEYIAGAYQDDLKAWYGILAYHYRQAENVERESFYVRRAAEEAARQYAVKQAAAFYDRAITLLAEHPLPAQDAFALHTGRFDQHVILGRYDRLLEDAQALSALAEELAPRHQVQAWTKLGLAVYNLDRGEEGLRYYERAARLAREHDDNLALSQVLRYWGHAHFGIGDYEKGKETLLEAIEVAGESGWRYEAGACQSLGWIVYDEGRYDETERLWQRALDIHQAHGHKTGEAFISSNLSALYATLMYVEKAIVYGEQGLRLSTQLGYKIGIAEAWIRLGELWLGIAQYKRAWDSYRCCLEMYDSLPGSNVWGQSYTRSRMAEVILEQNGDPAQAEALSRRALEIAQVGGGKELMGWLLRTHGRVLLRKGDVAGAQEVLEASARLRRELRQWDPYLSTLSDLGLLYLQEGEREAARDCVGEMLAWLHPPEGEGREVPEASLSCYKVLEAQGEGERAREVLRAAYELVMEYAERIETPEYRRSFLEGQPINREIVALYPSASG